MDIHSYDMKYSTTRKGIEEASISARNKELILNFVDDKEVQALLMEKLKAINLS